MSILEWPNNTTIPKIRLFMLMSFSFILSFSCTLEAALVTIKFSGKVSGIINDEDYPYDEIIKAGDTFTGLYTYNSETVDSSLNSDVGHYVHDSPYGINIHLNGLIFKTVEDHIGQFSISICNDFSYSNYDSYKIDSTKNNPLSTGLSVDGITITSYDESHQALSSTNLLSTAPDLNTWEHEINIGGGGGSNCTLIIWGNVTHAEVIPEPTTLALFGLGGLLLRRKK